MPACEHLDYEYFPRFHSDASTTEHTTEWYVSVVHPSHCWLVFDRMTVVMFLFSLSKTSSWQASFSTLQVALHPGLLPSVFGCTGHVFKFAIRPDVAASLTSNVTFAACLDHRCIDASQVKSLPFQHRKSHFIFDFRHRCSDAPDTSASWPYVRTLPLRSAATSPFRRVLVICASVRPKSSRFVSTPQVSLHSGLLPSVFGCTWHVWKPAIRPDVAVSISSNITFAAFF